MRDIKSIVSEAIETLHPLLEEAFEAGRTVGRQEAAAELKTKIAAVLAPDLLTGALSDLKLPPMPKAASDDATRVTPGTVKPTILRLIRESGRGLTTQEITTRTGFKPNSVRGTLWTLRKEGAVVHKGDHWAATADPQAVDRGARIEETAPAH
jgi:hypothetical protein